MVPLRPPPTIVRIARYAVLRMIRVALMLVIGVFLAVVILNFGGFIDDVVQANIQDALRGMAMALAQDNRPPEEIAHMMAESEAAMTEASGLNEPFLKRCVRWTADALTLDWGPAQVVERIRGPRSTRYDVRLIILDRLPFTLILAGTTNLVLFVVSLVVAMSLARNFGSKRDRLFGVLSLVSSAPSWVYGIILVLIFSHQLKLLPAGGAIDGVSSYSSLREWTLMREAMTPVQYGLSVAKHMILPASAVLLSILFTSVYSWRTFFLIHAEEDYVEMARARGLPPHMLERQYLLRPTLPPILTSLALLMVTFWESAIALEVFFDWPGIGNLFVSTIHIMERTAGERGISIGIVTIFAYLLAATVLVLDVSYALVDPRVRLGGEGSRVRVARRGPRLRLWPLLGRRTARQRLVSGRPRPEHKASRVHTPRRGDAHKLIKAGMRGLIRYPSVLIGTILIAGLVGLSIYTTLAIPYDEAAGLFRAERADKYEVPPLAQPAWVNLFRREKLPETIILSTVPGRPSAAGGENSAAKTVTPQSAEMSQVNIDFGLDYPYSAFPHDVTVRFVTEYDDKLPFIASLLWVTPDGREIELGPFATPNRVYSMETLLTKDRETLISGRGGAQAMHLMFADPGAETPTPLQGRYQLRLNGFMFEPEATLDAELLLQGKVYGLAGTDNAGRDLTKILLWGAPIALAFGLLGAVGTTLASTAIAAASAWWGGWLDDLVQHLSEMNLILPTLPIAIMVYYLYAKSVWVILGVLILLSIFGSTLKSMRAVFLQARDAPYVEAARAYGASDLRIIVRYLVPRVMPMLIPRLVALIPTYVFLEATLAYLGVSDLVLPTWGRLVLDAFMSGALQGHYYWALEPTVMLIVTGAGFALLGFGLDRVLNPRLRST